MFYKSIHVWAIIFSSGQPASSRENIPCQKECIKLWCNDLMYLFPIKAHKQSTLRNIWPIRVTLYHQCHVVYVYLYSISVLIWAWSWYQSSLRNIESVILSWKTLIFIVLSLLVRCHMSLSHSTVVLNTATGCYVVLMGCLHDSAQTDHLCSIIITFFQNHLNPHYHMCCHTVATGETCLISTWFNRTIICFYESRCIATGILTPSHGG